MKGTSFNSFKEVYQENRIKKSKEDAGRLNYQKENYAEKSGTYKRISLRPILKESNREKRRSIFKI